MALGHPFAGVFNIIKAVMTELAACLVSADCAVAVFYVAEVHTIIYICKVVHISHNPSVVAVVFVKDFSSVDTVLQIRIRSSSMNPSMPPTLGSLSVASIVPELAHW